MKLNYKIFRTLALAVALIATGQAAWASHWTKLYTFDGNKSGNSSYLGRFSEQSTPTLHYSDPNPWTYGSTGSISFSLEDAITLTLTSSTNNIKVDDHFKSILKVEGEATLTLSNDRYIYCVRLMDGDDNVIGEYWGLKQGFTQTFPQGLTFKKIEIFYGNTPYIEDIASGSGTSTDPYIINNSAQLDALAQSVNSAHNYLQGQYFELGDDISYSYTRAWNNQDDHPYLLNGDLVNGDKYENNFTPIGRYGKPFKGQFDGKGHTISGIRIYNQDTDGNQGLFGYVNGGTVKNLMLRDAIIDGKKYVGGLVGYLDRGTLSNCLLYNVRIVYPQGKYNAEKFGVITGYQTGSTISNTHYRDCLISCYGQISYSTKEPIWADTRHDDIYRLIIALNDAVAISASGESATIDGTTYYATGTTLTLNYGSVPSGYEIIVIQKADHQKVAVTDQGNGSYTFTMYKSDVTVSGPAPTIYSITYHLGGGTNADGNPETYTIESPTITLAAATLTGYTFGGWYDNEGLTGTAVTTIAAGSTGNVELWAKWTSDYWPGTGTPTDPYIITTTAQLDQLAIFVNNGTDDFSGKYFKLGSDITYSCETKWNDESSTENNYEAIGRYHDGHYLSFNGYFDGDGHTVKGIRINCGGEDTSDKFKGIFGIIGPQAIIHNLRLAETRITGFTEIGGIVGRIDQGIISDCQVEASVIVNASVSHSQKHGGIAGHSYLGTIRRCTSAVTLTNAANATECVYYGGIVGYSVSSTFSEDKSILEDNLVIGATIPNVNFCGAISGESIGILTRNYYTTCTVAGVANATGVGCNGKDVTVNDGAVPVPATASLNLAQGTKDGFTAWWGTWYHSTLRYTLPEGAQACTMGADHQLYRLGNDGRVIPAGVAVVIIADRADVTLSLDGGSSAIADHAPNGGNILRGSNSSVTVSGLGGTPYVLGVSNDAIGFYKYTGDAIPANRAYYLK